MTKVTRVAIVAALALAVGSTLALRSGKREAAAVRPGAAPPPAAAAAPGTPRILELGSNRCRSCQEMAKVLDALRASQGARLQVDFIDVFEQPEAADRHEIRVIPTQILYDGAGRELFRHTGYFAHDDILAKFRELGVRL